MVVATQACGRLGDIIFGGLSVAGVGCLRLPLQGRREGACKKGQGLSVVGSTTLRIGIQVWKDPCLCCPNEGSVTP